MEDDGQQQDEAADVTTLNFSIQTGDSNQTVQVSVSLPRAASPGSPKSARNKAASPTITLSLPHHGAASARTPHSDVAAVAAVPGVTSGSAQPYTAAYAPSTEESQQEEAWHQDAGTYLPADTGWQHQEQEGVGPGYEGIVTDVEGCPTEHTQHFCDTVPSEAAHYVDESVYYPQPSESYESTPGPPHAGDVGGPQHSEFYDSSAEPLCAGEDEGGGGEAGGGGGEAAEDYPYLQESPGAQAGEFETYQGSSEAAVQTSADQSHDYYDTAQQRDTLDVEGSEEGWSSQVLPQEPEYDVESRPPPTQHAEQMPERWHAKNVEPVRTSLTDKFRASARVYGADVEEGTNPEGIQQADYNFWLSEAAMTGALDAPVDEEEGESDEVDDSYEDENLGDDFEATPWLQPTHERAEQYRESVVYEGARAPLCSSVDMSDLGQGLVLYFNFLAALIVTFSLLVIVNAPIYKLYSSGSRIKAEDRDFLGLYAVTMGNMGVLQSTGEYAGLLGRKSLPLSKVGDIIAGVDVVCCVIFVGFIAYAMYKVNTATKGEHNITAKDYAVLVTDLPPDATKAEIMDHFSTLYRLDDLDWRGRPPPIGRAEPVYDVSNTGEECYWGKWVAEVTIARRNGRTLRTFLRNHKLTQKLKRIRAHMKMFSQGTPLMGGKGASAEKYDLYEGRLNECGSQMEQIVQSLQKDKRRLRREHEAIGAFVVFEYTESARRCVEDYSLANLRNWCGLPKPLHLRNCRLQVAKAPDPEDILWENLQSSARSRFLRRSCVDCIMLVLLIISFAIVIILTNAKTAQESSIPKFELCDQEIPALFLGGYSNTTTGLTFATPSPFVCPDCDVDCSNWASSSAYAVYTYKDDAMQPATKYSVSACRESACPLASSSTQCPCVDPYGVMTCKTVACSKPAAGHVCTTFAASNVAGCYCKQLLDLTAATSGWMTAMISLFQDNICYTVAKAVGFSLMLQLVLSFSTIGVNSVLTMVTRKLTAFERSRSSDAESSQLISKRVTAQYFNTSILLLLVYGSLTGKGPLVFVVRALGILTGPFPDFTVDWYAQVGVQLSLTALILALTPHMLPLLQHFVILPFKRWSAKRRDLVRKGRFVMQTDVNALYVGPRFDVAVRYPPILVMVFFSLTFSTGLPIMLAFPLMAFVLSFTIDRYLLLRFYRRPPQRDERLQCKVVAFLKYALFLHISCAIWMLSSDEIFGPSDLTSAASAHTVTSPVSYSDVIANRVSRRHVIPLFLLWLGVACYIFMVDILPSYYLTRMLSWVRDVISGLRSSSGPRRASNGFTKMYERSVPADFKVDRTTGRHLSPRYQDCQLHTYDDGSVVMRRLKSPTAAGPVSPKSACRKVWEVIKINGIYSYNIVANPRYRECIRVFMREFVRGDEDGAGGA